MKCQPYGFGFLPALFLIVASTAASAAAQNCAGAGNGQLTKLDRSAVRECIAKGREIKFAVLDGSDLISASIDAKVAVRVLESEVVGGLDFTGAGAETFRAFSAGERNNPSAAGLLRSRMYDPRETVRVIRTAIKIENSRIGESERRDTENQRISVAASRVIFLEQVDFTGTRISGGSQFARAAFVKEAAFDSAAFSARVTFDGAWFGAKASFERTVFEGTPLFVYCRFGAGSNFRSAQFRRAPLFDKARSCGENHFGDAAFPNGARFRAMQAAGRTVFLRSDFPNGADFTSAEFGAELDLREIEAAGLLSFANARIAILQLGSEERGSRVSAELDFSSASIAAAELRNSTFASPVSFADSKMGQVQFATSIGRNANPRRDPRMRVSAARVGCELPSAEREAAESPAAPDDKAAGPPGDEEDTVGAEQSMDSGPRDDQSAAPNWDINFEVVTFQSAVTFVGAKFYGPMALDRVKFLSRAEFGGAEFGFPPLEGGRKFPLRLNLVNLESVEMDWAALPPMAFFVSEPADELRSKMLEKLEAGFRKQQKLPDALEAREARGWAKIEEGLRCLTRFSERDETAPGACGLGDTFLAATVMPLWGISSGFGTSWTRLLAWVLVIDLFFAYLYARFGRIVCSTDDGKGVKDTAMRLRFLELPGSFSPAKKKMGASGYWGTFRRALALSTVVLVRFGSKDTRVFGRVGPLDMSRIVTIEWVLGILLLVDLVYTLSESQPFIQRLLTGAIG